jgi:predicted dehydrogenase
MYVGAFKAAPDIDVTMLYDSDSARARSHLPDYPGARIASGIREVLDNPDLDAVVIATPDGTHCALALEALKVGKHVLVDKPLALNPAEAREVLAYTGQTELVLQLAFTLRASPFYRRIHSLVREGTIGQVMGIEAAEHMGRDHGASYMRRWQRNSALSGGLLTNKCCHDLDILYWLAGAPARRLASFGGRDFFNAGSRTVTHCSGCGEDCRFRYNGTGLNVTEEMKANPTKYDLDLCAFTSNKDIVDNQVVIIEYENKVRATFTVQMFSDRSDRTIHISGTKGFIRGTFMADSLTVYTDAEGMREIRISETSLGSHGGGDEFLVRNFADSIRQVAAPLSCCADGVENVLTCTAAEIARNQKRTVALADASV